MIVLYSTSITTFLIILIMGGIMSLYEFSHDDAISWKRKFASHRIITFASIVKFAFFSCSSLISGVGTAIIRNIQPERHNFSTIYTVFAVVNRGRGFDRNKMQKKNVSCHCIKYSAKQLSRSIGGSVKSIDKYGLWRLIKFLNWRSLAATHRHDLNKSIRL